MEKCQQVKAFRLSYAEYLRNGTEDSINSMQRQLQILSVTSDLSVFDPGNSEAAEFYVSLHDLMTRLESRSALIWYAIGVLQHACRNPASRTALIHTYKFTPILTKLFNSKLNLEKQLRVLKLLQQLTYGIKISWQEAHLSFLIKTLAQWIVGDEKSLVEPSLSVLVNLCYKNLPAVYTLMRSVDNKQFLRSIFKLQNDNINTRVQVCKLLIILEHISGEIPADDIYKFVNVTFSSMTEAFATNDIFLMRHNVDFFDDVKSNEHSLEILLTYKSFQADTERLLSVLNNESEPECVGIMFQFLESLLSLKAPGLNSLYTHIVTLAMRWIRTDLSSTHSLSVIRAIASDPRADANVNKGVMEQLDQGFELLLLILDSQDDAEIAPNAETQARLTALIRLLQQMALDPVLRLKLLSTLDPQIIRKIFKPLISEEPTSGNNFFVKENTNLYVNSVVFLSNLAPQNKPWLELYTEILGKRQVQMILASALYTGDHDIKKHVLSLIGTEGFLAENISTLSQSLCDLEPLAMAPSGSMKDGTGSGWTSMPVPSQALTPLFSITQESRLDQFIAKLEETLQRNEIRDISTSAVMELYEFKLAGLGHSERALQVSLEAASHHSTHLQHKFAQVSAEASRLHQLLFHTQQTVEGIQTEKRELIARLETSTKNVEKAYAQNHRDSKAKQSVIDEKDSCILDLRSEISDIKSELMKANNRNEGLSEQVKNDEMKITTLQEKLSEQESLHAVAEKNLGTLGERIEKREAIIHAKDAEIESYKETIQKLKYDIATYESQCKTYMKNLEEKESKLDVTTRQLDELQRIRDAIFEISNPTAKKKKENL